MQTIRLSTTPGAVNPGAYLSQYDVGRQIAFLLFDDTGQYVPATGSTVHIRATKPSGFGFDVACTWSQNTVTATVTDDMSNESGSFGAELRIEKDGAILGTANFLWNVERSTHPDGTVDGNTEAKGLMQAIMAAITDAEEAAAAAAQAGLSEDLKQALLDCFEHVAWIDEYGQDYYDALYAALYPPIPATAITLNKSTLSLRELADTYTLVATVTPPASTETVTWSSSDDSVATVDGNGVVTAVDYGNATITARAGSVTATCAVTVAQVTLTGIDAVFTQGSATIYNNDSLDTLKQYLTVTATYSDSSTEVLDDSDYTLSGTLTVGTSTITAAYEGETDSFTVQVTQYVPHYAIVNNLSHVASSNPTTTVEENDSFSTSLGVQTGYVMQSVTVTMGGNDITASVYNESTRQISIPAVTGNVVITAVAAIGVVSISASFNQGSVVIYDTDSLDSLKQYLTVTATYSDSSTEVLNPSDYTLSGTLTAGTSSVTAEYEGKTDTFNVTVTHYSILPAGYDQVEWISSYMTGTQAQTYPTIVVPLEDVLELQFDMIAGGGAGQMWGGTNNSRIGFYNNGIYIDINNQRAGFLALTLNDINTVKCGNLWIESIEKGTSKTGTAQTGITDITWSLGNGQNESAQGQHIIYLKQFHGDTLVRHMIPCIRTSDDTPGYYDIVQDEFIYGTRSATTGGVV